MRTSDLQPTNNHCCCDVPVMRELKGWGKHVPAGRDWPAAVVRAIQCDGCGRPVLAIDARHPDHHLHMSTLVPA